MIRGGDRKFRLFVLGADASINGTTQGVPGGKAPATICTFNTSPLGVKTRGTESRVLLLRGMLVVGGGSKIDLSYAHFQSLGSRVQGQLPCSARISEVVSGLDDKRGLHHGIAVTCSSQHKIVHSKKRTF